MRHTLPRRAQPQEPVFRDMPPPTQTTVPPAIHAKKVSPALRISQKHEDQPRRNPNPHRRTPVLGTRHTR